MLRYLRGRVVSLRVALLLILAAGLWLGWRVDCVRRQERAVAAIREVGGTVVFDHYDAVGTEAPGVLARAFAAVREWIGDAFFRNVVKVSFQRSKLDDTKLAAISGWGGLGEFGRLEELILMDTNAGDEGLRQLGRMTQVRTLYLGGSKVTDGGMPYLKGWIRLGDLGVSNTQVGDAGMRLLDGLQLTGLGARNTRISPAEFSRILKVHPKIVIRY
jgi:hypothetical protein